VTYRRVKNPTEIVVIFKTHLREGADEKEYAKASRRMHELVETIPGFLSIKAYTGEDGDEIDIVRFKTEKALDAWRNQVEHRATQERGRKEFYDHYRVQVCRVFREYEFRLGPTNPGR
jgi:heme-degrading monooxygenase HmoA